MTDGSIRTADGFAFRDLNGNGKLDPYEDPRLPYEVRVADLVARMTLVEKAGLMFHTMMQPVPEGLFEPSAHSVDSHPLMLSTDHLVRAQGINHFNVGVKLSPREFADWQNRLQAFAANTRLGIPVTLSADPIHGFLDNPATGTTSGCSRWPEPIGLAATRDPALVRQFGDVARREYKALGLRVGLHPMADLATEPRWARGTGTFGSDADLASELVTAYIEGFQTDTLGTESVACMTKHFPGAGPQLRGEDAHFPYGKEQVYPGKNWEYHLRVFEAAFAAGTAQVMPYYGLPLGLGDGDGVEEVGFGFNREIITGWLRERYGFNGVICSDWGLVTDVKFWGLRWPARAWGAEELTRLERVEKIINAGCDQLGGEACPELIVELVESGRIDESRIDESASRILLDKFRLGLFDNPYVDPDLAETTVGREDFVAAGLEAQRRAMVLLDNKTTAAGQPTLPIVEGTRIHVEGIDPAVAAQYGKVAPKEQADVSVVRIEAPYEHRDTPDIDYERFFHAGRLDFAEPDRDAILAQLAGPPSVVGIFLDRPAIVPEIVHAAAATIAEFGATDEAFLNVVFGRTTPTGKLPAEMPSSMGEVEASAEDLPNDTANPLFPFGHGLSYSTTPSD